MHLYKTPLRIEGPCRKVLTKLDCWAVANHMRFDTSKCQIGHLGWSNHGYLYRTVYKRLENILEKRDLGGSASVHWPRKGPIVPLGVPGSVLPLGKGTGSPVLLCECGLTSSSGCRFG